MMTTFTANDHDYPDYPGWIRTVSGRYVNLLNPKAEQINVHDIAWALSLINRFGGHTAQPWSVGEHSLHVGHMLLRQFGDRTLALAGLLHDATEAYMGDVVRPLKRELPEYRLLEDQLADVIAVAMEFDPALLRDPRLKAADQEALVWEMGAIRNAWWRTPTPPNEVREAFLATLDQWRTG